MDTQGSKELVLRLNLAKILIIIVVFGIGLGVGIWAPWQESVTRSTEATGTATIKAEPDEYTFRPYFTATGADAKSATAAVRKIGDNVVDKLIGLGVDEADIKSDINAFEQYYHPDGSQSKKYEANESLTVTVNDKDLAQKVQDYLFTTNNEGSSTPYAAFSTEKETELKNQARVQAVANAKSQAEQMAGELGMKLGKVLEVTEVNGFDVFPVMYDQVGGGIMESGLDASVPQPSRILTGQQDLTFSVKVKFELK